MFRASRSTQIRHQEVAKTFQAPKAYTYTVIVISLNHRFLVCSLLWRGRIPYTDTPRVLQVRVVQATEMTDEPFQQFEFCPESSSSDSLCRTQSNIYWRFIWRFITGRFDGVLGLGLESLALEEPFQAVGNARKVLQCFPCLFFSGLMSLISV